MKKQETEFNFLRTYSKQFIVKKNYFFKKIVIEIIISYSLLFSMLVAFHLLSYQASSTSPDSLKISL